MVAVLMACTSSDPAPARDAGATMDGPGDATVATGCILVGGMCSSAAGLCCAQRGTLFDEARGCLTNETRVIGCAPDPIPRDSGCIELGIVDCVITFEGTVRRVWFTSSRATGGAAPENECPEPLRSQVFRGNRCD